MPSSQRRPAAATGRSLLTRWADVVIKRPAALLAVAVGLLVLAGSYGLGVFGLLSQGGCADPASESARELALERETFGNRSIDVVAVYSSDTLTADDPEFRAAVDEALAALPAGS